MPLNTVTRLLESDLQSLNATIIRSLESHVEVVNKIGNYLIESGGKRIRPLVVLLSAKACQAVGEDSITMAAIIEFIHTATLLHDDVVDDSKMRRGRPTANHVWDNPTAILVGDFLYSRAFQMMVSVNSMTAMRILADTTNIIAEGEVLQLSYQYQPDITETQYFQVIHCKTAKLFESAAQLGAVLAKQPLEIEQALANYGLHLGMAFQLIDDLLDYQADSESWGKNIGHDLSEGKATLPLIHALKSATVPQAHKIREAILKGDTSELSIIQEVIITSGAIDYTMQAAEQEIQKAKQSLSLLPPSTYRDALENLASFAITRGN